ncbi:MAG: EI24 domain-containing protein [Bacteriovoracaceae bacterium]|nr:EI24 domain-containing protein [Bacteriovoracaceae bacterium]
MGPRKTISLMGTSLRLCFRGPVNSMLTIIPIILGILVYLFIFAFLNDFIMSYTKPFLDKWLGPSSANESTLAWIIFSLLAIFFYFILNWTFVLIISLISSPFNDWLSQRVAKNFVTPKSKVELSISQKIMWLTGFLWMELKKILLIGFLTVVALLISYIPLLAIISLVMGFFLVAIQYLSFTWSREELSAGQAMRDLLKNFLSYFLSGAFFFLLVNIPLVNVIVPSLGTVFFTVLYYQNQNQDKETIKEKNLVS